MPYEFQITRRVEFADTDMAGIMHFANFFRFMEAAETAFFRSLGFSVALSRCGLEACLPRVHAECDYSAPLRFEDDVLVHLLVEKKGTRSLSFQFRFYRLDGSAPQTVARGRLVVACAQHQDNGTLKAVALPKVIAQKIQQAPPQVLADGFLGSLGPRPQNDHRASLHRSPSRRARRASRNTQHGTRNTHLPH